jgi:uncharacterized damage-inducible protein DinB
MSQIVRTEPPLTGTDAEILVPFLDYHRDTLRLKTEGLAAEQLDRRLEPSRVTLGGLLKHMAYVEDWWFNQVFAGSPAPEPWASVDWKADGDWEFHSAAADTPEQLRALLDETIAVSDRILTEALATADGLDAEAKRVSRRDPSRTLSLRWIVVHMLEEYARHNGHADLIRESIDGVVGE